MYSSNPILTNIFHLSEDNSTGTLFLSSDTESIELFFQDGLISAAASNLPRFRLGSFLTAGGFIEDSRLASLLTESQKKKRLLGETAVKRRLIVDTDLTDLVRDQITQLILHAMTSEFKVRDFKDSVMPVYLPAQFSSKQLLLEIARRNLQQFEPDPHRQIVLSNGHGLANLSWYPQELSVIGQLHTPKTLQELALATGIEYSRLCKILSVLDNLHMIASIEETEEMKSDTTAIVNRKKLSYESLVPEINKNKVNEKLEVFHNHSSFISEQFKSLKVRLHKLSTERPVQVITISSPHTQDGKSLVSTNLALSMSMDPERRVILLDCDLRNPSIHRYLGTSMEPGLCGYLSTDYLQPYCYMRRLNGLFIMSSGGVAKDPIEVLSLEKMQQLIEYLKHDFDTIIIDTPPLMPVSDAQILTNLADGMIVVVRSAKTTYTNLERSFRNLDRKKLLGLVLNDVQPRLFHTHYDYRYYNYGNRDVYPYGPKRTKTRYKIYFE